MIPFTGPELENKECGEGHNLSVWEEIHPLRGLVEVYLHCSTCLTRKEKVGERNLLQKDKQGCRLCGAKYLPDKSRDFCYSCRQNKTFSSPGTGLVVPGETDTVYSHQCGGLRCRNVYIEGSFVAVNDQNIRAKVNGSYRNLFGLLSKVNYPREHATLPNSSELWDMIDEQLPFKYEEVDAPESQPGNMEALKWVRITEDDAEWSSYKGLEGEVVAFFYPNSD